MVAALNVATHMGWEESRGRGRERGVRDELTGVVSLVAKKGAIKLQV